MTISFAETAAPTGLEVYDSIEQRRLQIETPGSVSFDTSEPAQFCFPVDRTCRLETDELGFNQLYSVTVHDAAGQTEASFDASETGRLEDRTQFVGLSGPIKLYCRIDAPGTIDIGLTSITITTDRETTIELGVRSLHDQPRGTITTPPDIDAMIDAVSALPSALKTTSPERTWPTLRGHPPLIELGDRLEIPDTVGRPDGDITITVPRSYASLYQVAPLAFFLGATIQPGDEPALETPAFTHPISAGHAFEDEVANLLKRFFFLDCIVRTEGVFQYDLLERSMLEDDLPFDFAATYDCSLAERLEQYLAVPFDVLEPHIPRWPLTAHVPSEPDSATLLPFIVNELGIVRDTASQPPESIPNTDATSSQLVRSATTARSSSPGPAESEFIVPAVTDESVEHAWFGDGVPQQASKATLEAYQHQLQHREPVESIELLLVCNDARMIDEHDLLDGSYGNRSDLPFEIDSKFGVDADQLATLLTDGSYDFFHFIGHATEDGLRCPDGDLDIRTLESVDVGVFFLNACRSYEQGLALTRRGAFGGVSTYADVINEHAVTAGETMARLLNRGFPLRGALEIARENSMLGNQYLIVGDGSADIAQSDGGTPGIIELKHGADDAFEFATRSYSTKEFKLGSATASTLESVEDRHLTPSSTPFFEVDRTALEEYLTWVELPVLVDGTLHWNEGIGSISID
ncbi:hypothetical protein [Natrinema limicola]|uniref:CHAT domain-containing protein n=1 Tax=Natrinema limicola JCM 13563 TaxID=1230457 RepID=M0C326_9EURY|nr:hypothetical protein [Natrinema limicola]ELZ17691.1 hypothetical protein C476_14703 [Natrinema limicola JCM 13563]